jgi:hypothetical protein
MTTRVSYNQKDALLIKETNFPTAAGTVYSQAFDLEDIAERGVRIDAFELLLTASAATAAQLSAGASNTFSLQFSDTTDFSANVTEWSAGNAWQQAGSATGAAEFERRYRVATDAPRYVRVKCVTAGTASQNGKAFEFAIVT